jgi:phenylalanyl-tRNA synthetase beta chain
VKAPLSWLREYVAVDLSAEELADRLAMTGTEVERVDEFGVQDEQALQHFVVGKVLSCQKHPNADKLSVCQVDVREDEPRTIVCGAPNVAAGQTVAVSLPGAVLPNGMAIKETKLRGVASSGMILSEAELAFEQDSPGIMVLPDEWEAGAPLADQLPVREQVLEVEVTPNRPDCLSVIGLAREIAAVTGEELAEPGPFDFPVAERDAGDDIAVEVWDPDLCPRYAARVIRGVTIGESPPWLKARLTMAGMRPINNVVDVTNYVMWSTGQPLHAFDLEQVAGRKVIARRAKPGESIVTLDGNRRILTEDMLVIADGEKPSVIAGIMGSLDSEVTESTTNILLEAANFSGPSIMKTSSALGLRSESSTRFEKGIDRNLVPLALDMAGRMLTEICGGTVSRGTLDVLAGESRPWQLTLRPTRVAAVLGTEVSRSEMAAILGRLGCEVVEQAPADGGEPALLVTVPTFRADLEREIDLVEEVARIHGLEKLPATIPPRRSGRGGLHPDQKIVRQIENVLRGAGLNQAMNYSFIDPSWLERLRLPAGDARRDPVVLANPLSQDQSVMRTLLLPGLLWTAQRNLSVREERVHAFELGKVFFRGPAGVSDHLRQTGTSEGRHLGFVLMGALEPASWARSGLVTDFFLAKGVVERVLGALGLQASYARAAQPFLHPGRSAVISLGDDELGWVGEVHPLVLRAFDLPDGVVAAELDAELVLGAAGGVALFEDLLTYPAVEQDLALIVDRDLPAEQAVQAVVRAGGGLLHDVFVFDVYEGSQVGEGKKSLALRLTFRSPERTLSEAEVHEVRERMLTDLRERLGAELRS